MAVAGALRAEDVGVLEAACAAVPGGGGRHLRRRRAPVENLVERRGGTTFSRISELVSVVEVSKHVLPSSLVLSVIAKLSSPVWASRKWSRRRV